MNENAELLNFHDPKLLSNEIRTIKKQRKDIQSQLRDLRQDKSKKEEKKMLHLDVYTTELKQLINQLNDNNLIADYANLNQNQNQNKKKHFRAKIQEIEDLYAEKAIIRDTVDED